VPLSLAIVEEFLARDPLAGGFGCDVEGEVDGELVGAVEERTSDLFPTMVLLACQCSDFWMTGVLPTVSSPLGSTDTMSGAYIVCITSKFLHWLHNSTNWLAMVCRLMVRSLLKELLAAFLSSSNLGRGVLLAGMGFGRSFQSARYRLGHARRAWTKGGLV
jgi:hypothetical protein